MSGQFYSAAVCMLHHLVSWRIIFQTFDYMIKQCMLFFWKCYLNEKNFIIMFLYQSGISKLVVILSYCMCWNINVVFIYIIDQSTSTSPDMCNVCDNEEPISLIQQGIPLIGNSQDLCESNPGRIFVLFLQGSKFKSFGERISSDFIAGIEIMDFTLSDEILQGKDEV